MQKWVIEQQISPIEQICYGTYCQTTTEQIFHWQMTLTTTNDTLEKRLISVKNRFIITELILMPKTQPLCTSAESNLGDRVLGKVENNWATSLSLFAFMHWRRKWQPTPMFLPGESQGWGNLVGFHLWGLTGSDTT